MFEEKFKREMDMIKPSEKLINKVISEGSAKKEKQPLFKAIATAAAILIVVSSTALAFTQGWITIGTPGNGGFVTDEAELASIIEANEMQDMTQEEVIAELERTANNSNRDAMSEKEISAAVSRYGIDLSLPGWTVSQAFITPDSEQHFPFDDAGMDYESFLRSMIPTDAPTYHVYCEILGLDLTFQPIPDNGWLTLSRNYDNGEWQIVRVYKDSVAVISAGS